MDALNELIGAVGSGNVLVLNGTPGLVLSHGEFLEKVEQRLGYDASGWFENWRYRHPGFRWQEVTVYELTTCRKDMPHAVAEKIVAAIDGVLKACQ